MDWAMLIRGLPEVSCPRARKVILAMDNFTVHSTAFFHKCFPPDVARSLANRMEIHYTPRHGSWLEVAEIGLSA